MPPTSNSTIPPNPLAGRWRHANGALFCGDLLVAYYHTLRACVTCGHSALIHQMFGIKQGSACPVSGCECRQYVAPPEASAEFREALLSHMVWTLNQAQIVGPVNLADYWSAEDEFAAGRVHRNYEGRCGRNGCLRPAGHVATGGEA